MTRTHHPSRATLLLPKSARQDVDTKSDATEGNLAMDHPVSAQRRRVEAEARTHA